MRNANKGQGGAKVFARLKNLDDRIFDNIPRIHRPAINKIMVTASKLGNAGIVWWYVCAMFLIIPKWRYSGLVIIFSIGLTSLMGEGIIKHAVKRLRPCSKLEEDDKRGGRQAYQQSARVLLVPVRPHGFVVFRNDGHYPEQMPRVCIPSDFDAFNDYRFFDGVSQSSLPYRCGSRNVFGNSLRRCVDNAVPRDCSPGLVFCGSIK